MQNKIYFLILCTCTFLNFIKGGRYLLCNNDYSCGINLSLIEYEYAKIDKPDE